MAGMLTKNQVLINWKKQKKNIFNQIPTHRNSSFDDAIHDDIYDKTFEFQINNGIDTVKSKEFKHAISFPQSELDVCAHNHLLSKALDAQNALAYNPDGFYENTQFMNTQIDFRDWRGTYMLEKTVNFDGTLMEGIREICRKSKLIGNYRSTINNKVQYQVEFTVRRKLDNDNINEKTAEDIEKHSNMENMSLWSNVDYDDVVLEDITPLQIIEIIKQTNFAEGEIQHIVNNKKITKEKIDKILLAIEDNFRKHTTTNQHYFKYLGAGFNVDKTARFAQKGNTTEGIESEGEKHAYLFDINRFMPSQEKIYQNPNVVEKMTMDFLQFPVPASHADLTVELGHGEKGNIFERDHLIWTIHKTYLNQHMATHVTYLSQPKTSSGADGF